MSSASQEVAKLQERKASLEEELARTERQIYDLEGEYLQETVKDGNIHVTSARVLVSKPKSLGMRIDTRLSEPEPFERGQPLTLLYARTLSDSNF